MLPRAPVRAKNHAAINNRIRRSQNACMIVKSRNLLLCLQLSLQFADQPVPFRLRKPARLRRPVRQIKDGDDPENDGGSSLQNEEPAPSGQLPPMNS